MTITTENLVRVLMHNRLAFGMTTVSLDMVHIQLEPIADAQGKVMRALLRRNICASLTISHHRPFFLCFLTLFYGSFLNISQDPLLHNLLEVSFPLLRNYFFIALVDFLAASDHILQGGILRLIFSQPYPV